MNKNRVIKFRIWDVNLNMFLTIKESDTFNLYYFLNRPNDFVVQQFTGLKDKNNREIFEGDIVKIKGYDDWNDNVGFDVIYQVRWCDIHVGWRGFTNKMIENDKSAGCGLPNPIKIIGNLFETPDLLKQ